MGYNEGPHERMGGICAIMRALRTIHGPNEGYNEGPDERMGGASHTYHRFHVFQAGIDIFAQVQVQVQMSSGSLEMHTKWDPWPACQLAGLTWPPHRRG